ncbi:MAG TPA: type II toxin-antitoxin system VapC family toxin, partial [Allosphingosinicella sp.]
VALLTNEPHSWRADAWLIAQQGREIALSRWTETEVAAALAAKARVGGLDLQLLEEARQSFWDFVRSARRLPIAGRHFELATRFASDVDAKLRGGDALHLAVASEGGAVLCTLDRGQAEAAKVLDMPFELI